MRGPVEWRIRCHAEEQLCSKLQSSIDANANAKLRMAMLFVTGFRYNGTERKPRRGAVNCARFPIVIGGQFCCHLQAIPVTVMYNVPSG